MMKTLFFLAVALCSALPVAQAQEFTNDYERVKARSQALQAQEFTPNSYELVDLELQTDEHAQNYNHYLISGGTGHAIQAFARGGPGYGSQTGGRAITTTRLGWSWTGPGDPPETLYTWYVYNLSAEATKSGNGTARATQSIVISGIDGANGGVFADAPGNGTTQDHHLHVALGFEHGGLVSFWQQAEVTSTWDASASGEEEGVESGGNSSTLGTEFFTWDLETPLIDSREEWSSRDEQ